jgi:CDGSH-type Zn-finger protein/uncharacterized Fe-S cluster protein YjdI
MPSKPRRYESSAITVTYDLRRCIHAAECTHGLPAVFNRDGRPWVDPSAADADAIAAVVQRCPTGALRYTRHDGGAEELVPTTNEVTVVEDGPLYMRGDLEVHTSEGVLKLTRAAFCRCGASANKPFCDDSHSGAGFTSAPPAEVEPRGTETTGPLRITMRENGSLKVEGHFAVRTASGEAIPRGPKTSLCRCGHSATKPFCDAAHRAAGFTAPGSGD